MVPIKVCSIVIFAFLTFVCGAPLHAQWVQTNGPNVGPRAVIALAVSGTNLFAGASFDGVYRSTDNGTSWTEDTAGMGAQYVAALAVIGANLFAGTFYGVYLSTDNGTNWTAVNSGLTNDTVITLAVIGLNLFAGTQSGGVFLSTDNGISWRAASTGLPANAEVNAFAVIGTNLFAEAIKENGGHINGGGVFISTNNGDSWDSASTGLNAYVNALAVSGTNIFAGDDVGVVWRRPLLDFGISAVAQAPPMRDAIRSYPNPFSQSTEIAFTSATAGYAEVSVVNILGVEAAHLFSGELEAGNHSFAWDAQGMAQGSYWCIVRMGGSVERIALSIER